MGKKHKKKSHTVSMLLPAKQADKVETPSRTATFWLAPAVAIILILTGGVIYGLQSNRWMVSGDVQAAAAKVQELPMKLGDWEATDVAISKRQLEMAGAVGHVNRIYKNRIDGRQVFVMLLCGDHGPISLHPPTVCFTSAGWNAQSVKTNSVDTLDGKELGEFRVGKFQRMSDSGRKQMLTYWAWNANEKWECPKRPRFAFAGSPHLYKLYVSSVRSVSIGEESLDDEQSKLCVDFMRLLLPALRKAGI